MTDFIELAATEREVKGKTNRKLKPLGLIPAVLYGRGMEPVSLSLDRHTFEQLMIRETLSAKILDVKVDGHDDVNAIVKTIQLHPVSGRVQHVDLLAVDLTKAIHTTVGIEIVGDSEGVKEGGILTHNIYEVDIEALPTDLPDSLVADIGELGIGDSLNVSDLQVPDGVTVLTDEDTTVCSITLPTKVEEEVPEELEEELLEGEELEEGEEGAEAAEEGEEAAGEAPEEE